MQNAKHYRQIDRLLSFKSIVFLTILLLLFTRAITATHNIELHPDEHVFYEAADSLMHFIARTTDKYVEVKEYPEGTIVLQLPFHIVAALLRRYSQCDVSSRLCGRIASVFYFTLGAIVGTIIEYRFFGKNTKSVLAYAAILIFSIMHIEQSRYGTGDALSFFLTMLVLYLTLIGEGLKVKKRFFYWIANGFFVGLLCAVKYPLIFWGLIPIIAAWRTEKGNHNRIYAIILITVSIIIGFWFGSPKAFSDPSYIFRAVKREMRAYVLKGNVTEVGGPVNHFLSLVLYSFLYAGFPFAPVFFALAWKEKQKLCKEDKHSFLLSILLPSLIIIFFFYNLFAKTLFMRTYYPFFFMMDLYVADYLGKKNGRREHAIICVLLSMFLIRGIYYINALTEKFGVEKLDHLVSEASDDSWNKTTLLSPGYFVSFHRDSLVNPQKKDLLDSEFENKVILDSGELVITGSIEFHRGTGYFLPIADKKANQYCERWDNFKRENQIFFVGDVYPVWYYYIFGYWIKGTTGCAYEFPTNYVYYCGSD